VPFTAAQSAGTIVVRGRLERSDALGVSLTMQGQRLLRTAVHDPYRRWRAQPDDLLCQFNIAAAADGANTVTVLRRSGPTIRTCG